MSSRNMLAAVKAFKVDGLPLGTVTETYEVPRNTAEASAV
jgi:hypothetical protein